MAGAQREELLGDDLVLGQAVSRTYSVHSTDYCTVVLASTVLENTVLDLVAYSSNSRLLQYSVVLCYTYSNIIP